MSRAMNIRATEQEVAAACEKAGVRISSMEILPDGGTHLVTITGEGADEMRHIFAKQLISGKVRRIAFISLRSL